MIEVSPEFAEAWQDKSPEQQAENRQELTAQIEQQGNCEFMLVLPDSSMRAMALQGKQGGQP